MSVLPEMPAGHASRDELVRENVKLRKIVKALVGRVERSTDAQGNAFSLFQAAITLEGTVKQRTAELQLLNRQLNHEIEERHAIEDALQDARAEAERANIGKTSFLAAASHDLRQPISLARLFLDTLAERIEDRDSAALLDRAGRSLAGAQALLETLLEISSLDAGAFEPDIVDIALDPLLMRLGDDYAHAAEERQLRLRVVPCNAVVRTDPRLLERLLGNLIGNALRYTKRGGTVVGGRRRGDFLRVEVWDTGPGIPNERLDEIFLEFHRLESSEHEAGGMGLGLSIVQRIARVLGIEIEVRSRLGRGSVFSVDLPLGDAAAAAGPDCAPRVRATNVMRGRTVLVIDNDPLALREIATHLRKWGLYTLEARSLRGAVSIANAHGDLPSAIVADEHPLDGLSGLEVIGSMRARLDAPIPAVIMTDALPERAAVRDGLWFLRKPLRPDRLRSLLHHVLTNAA